MIDLTGQRFGQLVVLSETSPYTSPAGKKTRRWLCRCDCGKQVTVLQNALTSTSHPTRSCGCTRLGHVKDMTGQRFGRLLVIAPVVLDQPLSNGQRTIWRCRCDCGNTVDLSRKTLLSGKVHSCGCLLKDASAARVSATVGHVDGTTLSAIRPERQANKNSKSGVKGVHWSTSGHCWIARIGVQGRSIFLGRFDDLAKATAARKAAEKKYFGPLIASHPEYPKK